MVIHAMFRYKHVCKHIPIVEKCPAVYENLDFRFTQKMKISMVIHTQFVKFG